MQRFHLLLPAVALAACTAEVRETDLLRPLGAGALTPEAVAGVVPAYTLAEHGNLANMARIEEPLLILVGSKDGTTPPRLSHSLYAASPLPRTRKTLLTIAGAGHENVMTKPETILAYRAFLAALD